MADIGKNPSLTRGLVAWGVKGVLYKLFVAVVLMLSAGRWDWLEGWLYVVIFLLFDAATALVVIPRSPALLIERGNRQKGVKSWDKVLMVLVAGFLPMISWIVAGLDERLGWQPVVGQGVQMAALVVTVLGYAIVVWAMAANAFFSTVVRVQSERGHQVASGGPYRFVRHPGYVGAILFTAATPLLLGSWWAFAVGALAAGLFVVRTSFEDRFLQGELPGYRDYAQKTRYRLLPGIW